MPIAAERQLPNPNTKPCVNAVDTHSPTVRVTKPLTKIHSPFAVQFNLHLHLQSRAQALSCAEKIGKG